MLKRIRDSIALVLALAAGVSFMLGCQEALFGGFDDGPAAVAQMYYTVDDGKTYFADDATKLAPFDKDGKEAVRCYVFKCADGKEFVAYLERINKDTKAKYEAALKELNNPNDGQAMMHAEMLLMEGTEVKKTGEGNWVKRSSVEADKITMINCPDGNNAALEIVLP